MILQNVWKLFSRLAESNVGSIDWTDNIADLFARIQLSFQLPVTYK